MNRNAAYTETVDGFTINIIHDDSGDTESPIENDLGDNLKFAALHRRYVNPSKELDSVEAIAEFMQANSADDSEWACFPLFMYDHSGTIYHASEGGNPFACQWDSGRLGMIALKRSEYTNATLETANLICDEYTAWANGECYGFEIEDGDGEHVDSCWGFIGDPEGHVLEEAREKVKWFAADKRKREQADSDAIGIAQTTFPLHVAL